MEATVYNVRHCFGFTARADDLVATLRRTRARRPCRHATAHVHPPGPVAKHGVSTPEPSLPQPACCHGVSTCPTTVPCRPVDRPHAEADSGRFSVQAAMRESSEMSRAA